MSKFLFIYNFLIRKHNSKNINWNFIFPLFGVITGSIAIMLTIAIMEGMEYSIFSQLKNISFPSKFINIQDKDMDDIIHILKKRDIKVNRSIESQIILSKKNDFRIVNIQGLESIIIAGVFNLNILDYNQNYIYCSYDLVRNWIDDQKNSFLFTSFLDNSLIKSVKDVNSDIIYTKWDDSYSSFISAMKMEKLIYSLIGFLIIIIAAFTLMSMMSLAVMKKIPQIGMLLTLGVQKQQIKYIFLTQSIFTSLLGSSLGAVISYLIVYFNNKYNLIAKIFSANIPFDFPLILNISTVLITFIFSLLLLIIAGAYPSIKASKINIVKAIGFKK